MLIAFAVFCTLIEAIFTAFEVALGAVSRSHLRALAEERNESPEKHGERGNSGGASGNGAVLGTTVPGPNAKRAACALSLNDRPERLTLLFITVTSLSLWCAAGSLTWQALNSPWPVYVLPAALAGVLFVAEVLPLLIAARNADTVALRGADCVALALKVLAPLLWVVGGAAFGTARLLGSGPEATASVTEGELRSALATAEEEGVIEADERAMLEGAMDFREKVVREVMTRRVDIVSVPCGASLQETLELALSAGHSRLPVYDGTVDRIAGIVATKDLLPYLKDGLPQTKTARDVARAAFFVPENKRIASTLEELRRQRTLLAIVVDADGGTAGLVTIEDLLEELVGEIQDEYDVEEPPLRVVEEGPLQAVRSEAGTTVRDFVRFWERNFHMVATLRDLEGEEAESAMSLAGLALALFESVPQPADRITCGDAMASTADIRAQFGLQMEIVAMDGPRIEEVIIRLVTAP